MYNIYNTSCKNSPQVCYQCYTSSETQSETGQKVQLEECHLKLLRKSTSSHSIRKQLYTARFKCDGESKLAKPIALT